MPNEQPPFDRALGTLGALLAERGLHYELYAVGGGALQLLGLIVRPTKDIDLLRCEPQSAMSPSFSISQGPG